MTRRGRGAPGVPDELDELLLQVCFLPPDQAARIWDGAIAGRDWLDDLPAESHGLLPLLHRRLVELDRRPPELERLHGVRRRLWVQNELRLRAVRAAVDALDAAGVRAALLGGIAVLARHLGRLDLRPIHDTDLLVAPGDAARAQSVLDASGWRVDRPWRNGFLLDLNGVRCTDGTGQSLLLRWSTAEPYADALERAVPAPVGNAPFLAVCAGDLLVHTVLDGARAATGARVRWASDVLAVLAGDEPIDWHRVASTASARRGLAVVTDALCLLDAIVPLPRTPDADVMAIPAGRGRASVGAGGPPTVLRAYARRLGRRAVRR